MPSIATVTRAPSKEEAEAFEKHLFRLYRTNDRGALARIRRAHLQGPEEVILREIGGSVPAEARGRALNAYLFTAGLFAVYAAGAADMPAMDLPLNERSLGASARRVPNPTDSFERRFASLLARPFEDLRDELRRFLRLLRAAGAPVDFARLVQDLARWDHPDRHAQRRWARDFWQARQDSSSSTE